MRYLFLLFYESFLVSCALNNTVKNVPELEDSDYEIEAKKSTRKK